MLATCTTQFSRASGAVLVMTGPRLRADIRKTLFSYLQHHSHRYFISHFAGSLANRISEVSMSSMHALWAITFDFYPLVIKSAVALIVLFTASNELALVLTIWLAIYVYVSYVLAKRCRVYAQDFAAADDQVQRQKRIDDQTEEVDLQPPLQPRRSRRKPRIAADPVGHTGAHHKPEDDACDPSQCLRQDVVVRNRSGR